MYFGPWLENHHAAVEAVWEADFWRGSKGNGEVEELVGCAQRESVGIQIDDSSELGLLPECDFSESDEKIWTIHSIKGGKVIVSELLDIYYVVEVLLWKFR